MDPCTFGPLVPCRAENRQWSEFSNVKSMKDKTLSTFKSYVWKRFSGIGQTGDSMLWKAINNWVFGLDMTEKATMVDIDGNLAGIVVEKYPKDAELYGSETIHGIKSWFWVVSLG